MTNQHRPWTRPAWTSGGGACRASAIEKAHSHLLLISEINHGREIREKIHRQKVEHAHLVLLLLARAVSVQRALALLQRRLGSLLQ